MPLSIIEQILQYIENNFDRTLYSKLQVLITTIVPDVESKDFSYMEATIENTELGEFYEIPLELDVDYYNYLKKQKLSKNDEFNLILLLGSSNINKVQSKIKETGIVFLLNGIEIF